MFVPQDNQDIYNVSASVRNLSRKFNVIDSISTSVTSINSILNDITSYNYLSEFSKELAEYSIEFPQTIYPKEEITIYPMMTAVDVSKQSFVLHSNMPNNFQMTKERIGVHIPIDGLKIKANTT